MPFNNTVLPTGYEWFTSANGYHIVGAGSTYAVGATGGSLTCTAGSTSSTGSHTGTLYRAGYCPYTTGDGAPYPASSALSASGEHTHTVTFSYTPAYQTLKFIKLTATGELTFPADCVFLTAGNTAPTGLSRDFDDERFLKAGSTKATAVASAATSISCSTAANHKHSDELNAFYNTGTTYTVYETEAAGSHAHATFDSETITQAIKRAYLSAWTSAAATLSPETGIIAMFESITPPYGWYLCNGSNGTPDLRDYFIVLSADGTTASAGANTLTLDIETVSDGDHDHQVTASTDTSTSYQYTYHSNSTGAHTHTITGSKSYTPPYYSLAFIMKA